MSAKDLEAQIILEYSTVKALIAIHPYSSVVLALLLGAVIGHLV